MGRLNTAWIANEYSRGSKSWRFSQTRPHYFNSYCHPYGVYCVLVYRVGDVMSELISGQLITGKEALIALANGDCVEYTNSCTPYWRDLAASGVSINEVVDPKFNKFRLKPKIILINNIEVPAPFEPKCMEDFYVIDGTHSQGWINGNPANPSLSMGNPKWRTEGEIKQVVAAIRSVFEIK